MKTFFKLLPSLIIPMLFVFGIIVFFHPKDSGQVSISEINLPKKADKKNDHSQYEILKQKFETPQDLTKACLSCHNKRGAEIIKTTHWKWTTPDTLADGTVKELGKKNTLNNFCVGIQSNDALCQTCHIGYGWGDKTFDHSNVNNIDCIVCHDNSGKYKKEKGKAGMPSQTVDLSKIAQKVGPTKSKNCGNCHFLGGGGNNVKHGDLELAQLDAVICTKDFDVHLSKEGANLECSQCHQTTHHNISGTGPMTNSNGPENRVSCTQCHTDRPHENKMLNNHYKKVACQTCHISTYAKHEKTKIFWDWSTCGLKNGEPFEEISEDGLKKSDSGHGTAIYATNLTPEYFWWNGVADKTTLETKITTDTVDMNALHGDYLSNDSKIYPFKVMRGKQPYDTKNKTFVQFKTFGPKGSGAYWSDFDWDKSIRTGMDYAGYPYSGNMGFISTRSYWPLNHMVGQAESALTCVDCHSRNGKLQNLTGFYLPGRDVNLLLDWAGKLFVLFSVLGVIAHSTLRIIAKRKNKIINK